jgi:hypothetical protein
LRRRPQIIFPHLIVQKLRDAVLTLSCNAGIKREIDQQPIRMPTIVSLVPYGIGCALVPQSVSNLMAPA